MPLSVSGGCAAILDSERMFFAGGLTDVPQGEFIDFALIYDKRTNQVEATDSQKIAYKTLSLTIPLLAYPRGR